MRKVRLFKFGIASASALLILAGPASISSGDSLRFTTPFKFTPFTVELPVPPTVQPVAQFDTQCTLGAPASVTLKPPKFYDVTMKPATVQIIPGVNTTVWGYDGLVPGPTFKVKHDEPTFVRFHNGVNATTIVHNHGAHVLGTSDGAASTTPAQLIPPGEFRDFCYPNIAPVNPVTGEEEIADFSSSQWYHDHAHLPDLDLGITGQNVYMGLAGYYLLTDEIEQGLIDNHVLPGPDFDIPLVFADKVFAANGELIFDVDSFNGALGDVFTVNGVAQPVMHVQRRKYRFRMLNGGPARWWEFRLSAGKMLAIAADSWLLPKAVTPVTFDNGAKNGRVGTVRLAIAERAGVIIDFASMPAGVNEVFLENILQQTNGRGPDGVKIPGTQIIKFVIEGDPVQNDVTVAEGTPLRPHIPILSNEIVKTRTFEFERRQDHWQINHADFDPHLDNATPAPNTAEKWILKNGGGGWTHPIHIHLEAHNIQSLSQHKIPPQEQFKKDTVKLDPGETAVIFIKFRTFEGRYVFHCHNLEHEDNAMMMTFNVGGIPIPDFTGIEPGVPGSPPALVVPGD